MSSDQNKASSQVLFSSNPSIALFLVRTHAGLGQGGAVASLSGPSQAKQGLPWLVGYLDGRP